MYFQKLIVVFLILSVNRLVSTYFLPTFDLSNTKTDVSHLWFSNYVFGQKFLSVKCHFCWILGLLVVGKAKLSLFLFISFLLVLFSFFIWLIFQSAAVSNLTHISNCYLDLCFYFLLNIFLVEMILWGRNFDGKNGSSISLQAYLTFSVVYILSESTPTFLFHHRTVGCYNRKQPLLMDSKMNYLFTFIFIIKFWFLY